MTLLEQEGYDLIGAAIEVYNEVGHGFLEEVYQDCMEIELQMRGIPFQPQPELQLGYKERALRKKYKPHLFVSDGIVVELKAMKQLTDNEAAQILNYLKATKKRVGYLINFGNPERLEWKRFVK